MSPPLALAFAAARVGPLAWSLPRVGAPARLLLVGLLVAQVAAMLAGVAAPPAVGPAILAELLVGGTLALWVAVPFVAAQAAGLIVEDSLTPPASPDRPSGALPTAFALLAAALFVSLSGPRLLVGALQTSYRALPVGGGGALQAHGAAAESVGAAGAALFVAAAGLAAPALATLLFLQLAAALVRRGQPALDGVRLGPAAGRLATLLALAVSAFATTRALGLRASGAQLATEITRVLPLLRGGH
jgi:flagellar biosynthesis protein FliR